MAQLGIEHRSLDSQVWSHNFEFYPCGVEYVVIGAGHVTGPGLVVVWKEAKAVPFFLVGKTSFFFTLLGL